MAKAFAKGIPPEDWYETSPKESDWSDRAMKLLVHLPVNSLHRPEKVDRDSEPERLSCAETEMEHEMPESLAVSTADRRSMAGAEGVESTDPDSDDERISRVIQSCMEPLVVNVKTTTPSDDGDEPGHDSPTTKSSVMAMALMKSGISPEMVRRRLQKVEAKLTALRCRKKTPTEVPKPADASGSHSVDLVDMQPVLRHVDEDIPQKQSSDVSVSHTSAVDTDEKYAECRERLSEELCRTAVDASHIPSKQSQTVGGDELAFGKISASSDLMHNPKVDIASAILHKVDSEQLSGSSKGSDHVSESTAVVQQQRSVLLDPGCFQLRHERASASPSADDSGSRMDAASDLPWYVGYLSLDTKWDSQFIESPAVSRTLVEAMRNWRLRKPLDLIVSGQLRDVALDWTPMKTTWKTDHTVDCCWNSVLWYFNALLGEQAEPLRQQPVSEEYVGANSVEVMVDDDWWGIGRDKIPPPASGPVENSQTAADKTSLLSSDKQDASLPGLDVQKSHHSAVEPSVEKNGATVDSVVVPSDNVFTAPAADTHRKSSSRSGSSHREKSERSDVQKLSESSPHSGAELGSEKCKRKHEDRKKSKHSKLTADDSSKSAQPAKDSGHKDQDTGKENKKEPDTKGDSKRKEAHGKEKEKHPKKTKKLKQEVGDVEDKAKEHVESADSTRGADFADLMRVFVGSDEKKLSLLLKAMCNAKQFNSHKLTTSTSLHWAVALALLDENLAGKDAVFPASLLSNESVQPPEHGFDAEQPNSSKSVTTESSVKGVFESVSDFMNAVLSGRSEVSGAKSAAANGLLASRLDELPFSESDNISCSSIPNSKVPTAGKVKVKVESEVADEMIFFGPKVYPSPVAAKTTVDATVVEEMNNIKVDKSTSGKEKFVLPEMGIDQKVVFSKQASSADTVKAESPRKQHKQKTAGGVGKDNTAETDGRDHVSSKQPKKSSSVVGKTLNSLRDESSRPEDQKVAHRHHHSKKETSSGAEKRTADSSVSRKPDTKSKHSSSRSHSSQHEKSQHGRHEKKDTSHDHHKKSAGSEKRTSRKRPLTSSFETISDTELEGQANDDRSSRPSRQHARVGRHKTDASDKAKTSDARVDSAHKTIADSANKAPRRPDEAVADSDDKTSSVVQTEKTTSQAAVRVSSGSTGTVCHITYRPSNIFKMGSVATAAAPTKTATTDMFLASRGPVFMQTFRRSQIAKRRVQRETQQTATGGKLLTAPHRSPSTLILSKPVVRPIGLTLEATLAALSTSTSTGQSDPSGSQLQSWTSGDSSTAVSLSPAAACSLSAGGDMDPRKSPLKVDSFYSAGAVPYSIQVVPPLPASSPTARGAEDAPPLPEDDERCDSRTTSVAGSPPPDLSMLCGDSLLTGVEKHNISMIDSSGSLSDATPGFGSVYPYSNLSTAGSASEQFAGQTDPASSYWMMPSYRAYGYESSVSGSAAYAWYYGQALYSTHHPLMMPASSVSTEALDTVPPSSDVLASGDGSYGSYQSIPPLAMPPTPDSSFSDVPSSQQEMAWPMHGSYGFDPQFSNSSRAQISPSVRLRAPPRLSSDDETVPAWLQTSPLLPLQPDPSQADAVPPLMPPGYMARFSSSSSDVSGEDRVLVGPRKKHFFIHSNNAQLKAQVTVSGAT